MLYQWWADSDWITQTFAIRQNRNYLCFELYSCINLSDDDPARHWLQHLPTTGQFLNLSPSCKFLPSSIPCLLWFFQKQRHLHIIHVTCNEIDWLQNYIQGSSSDGYWATYKTWHRSKGLYNFFFQLAASVPVLLPLGAVSSHSTSSPSPCCPPHGFSPVLGTFCWHSLTHVLSLGPDSLVTSSTNRQTVCLLNAKYCHYMYVLGRHCQM